MPQFVFQFAHGWLFGFIPVFGHYELKLLGTLSLCVDVCFIFVVGKLPKSGVSGSFAKCMFTFMVYCHAVF